MTRIVFTITILINYYPNDIGIYIYTYSSTIIIPIYIYIHTHMYLIDDIVMIQG